MDKIIKNVLEKIENAGFEAYLVGGFVRDYLIGIKSLDIDICTNALPKDLHNLFPNNNNNNNYGGFNLKIKNYNIDITTYRKEFKYLDRKPTEIVYINDLKEDIIRRDFTINAICMDKNEKIIDLLNGVADLNNHLIKMPGDINKRLKEDPLRILRAVRFASILDFDIDSELYKALKENYKLVNTLSMTRIKQELDKILLNKNFLKGLNILKNLKILDLINITFDDITFVKDICGMWAQLKFNYNYAFTKQEFRNIINIRQIVEKGIIDNNILFNYGLYNSLVAAEILNIDKKSVNKMYENLPLKNYSDLDISNKEIIDLLNIEPSKYLSHIKNNLIDLILDGKLTNDNNIIKNYLLENET